MMNDIIIIIMSHTQMAKTYSQLSKKLKKIMRKGVLKPVNIR